MKNIELKAEYPDLNRGEQIARRVGAELQWRRSQRDTYFRVKSGRLKIRESEGGAAELISYFRPDLIDLRESQFHRIRLHDAEAFRQILTAHWGLLVAVEKVRTLYLIENIRIHLDRVKGLGNFLEFEGMLHEASDVERTQSLLQELRRAFDLSDSQLIATSYCDLLAKDSSGGDSHINDAES